MGDAFNRFLVEGQAMRGIPVDFGAGIDELLDTHQYPPGVPKAVREGIGGAAVTGGNAEGRGRILL